jgi:hypothetical protein
LFSGAATKTFPGGSLGALNDNLFYHNPFTKARKTPDIAVGGFPDGILERREVEKRINRKGIAAHGFRILCMFMIILLFELALTEL